MFCEFKPIDKLSKGGHPLHRCDRCGREWPSRTGRFGPEECPAVPGFGDKLASLIKRKTNIQPCEGCKRRAKFINRVEAVAKSLIAKAVRLGTRIVP